MAGRARRRWGAIGTVIALLSVSSCSDPSGPSGDRFDFVSVDHNAHWLLGPGVIVTGGSLIVGRDDGVEQRLTLACDTDSPGCSVPSDWARLQGVVDRTPVTPSGDMAVEWSDGRTALLRMAGDSARVGHPLPPAAGFAGQSVFRFRR